MLLQSVDLEVEDGRVEVVVGLVVDQVVEVGAVLHLAELGGEVPLVDERIERTACRAHRDAQQRHRPDDDVDADVAQLVDREQLALAELRHVGEDRHVDRGAHRGELLERAHRLGEDRVGPGIHQRLGPVDRGIEPVDGRDVGARHDEEVRVATRVDGGADALERGVLVDHGLAVEVAAALRVDLVLDVRAGEARVLERLDRAGDVHRLAEAGVGVDDRRAGRSSARSAARGRRPR